MRTVQLTTLVLATTLAAAAMAGLAEDVARQLSNPVAVLISLPFQFKHDRDFGPARDGSRRLADIQPVVPFELNDDWNIVSRTILPVVQRGNTLPGAGRQSGIGDAV